MAYQCEWHKSNRSKREHTKLDCLQFTLWDLQGLARDECMKLIGPELMMKKLKEISHRLTELLDR